MNTPKIFLLDIEGTTTPISFVYDTLFPYARVHVGPFLASHGHELHVASDVADLVALAALDDEQGSGLPEPVDADDVTSVVSYIHRLMDNDRKVTPLKSLQGKIWAAGYRDGLLEGEVFDDVPAVMRDVSAHASICIYSSGSVAAQRLLFGHSTAGDLTGLIDGYFDTTTGPKKVAASYRAIADQLNVPTGSILFGTDNLAEAEAAREAGVHAVILERPGNPALGDHDFDVWKDLTPARALFSPG